MPPGMRSGKARIRASATDIDEIVLGQRRLGEDVGEVAVDADLDDAFLAAVGGQCIGEFGEHHQAVERHDSRRAAD